MDKDNYPTEETLSKIENWDPEDFKGLADFIVSLWIYDDYLDWDGTTLHISTGGWSGHEDILGSLPQRWIKNFCLSSRRGGHYIYKRS